MTNTPDFFENLSRLKRNGESFTTATVVSRRAPVSSHIGDRAIIFADGRMEGFVGGSCSREIVRKQALEALRLGKPRLVLIRPDATLETLQHAANAESIVVPMTCASEGAADVYLEPHTRARVLLVAGFTPVAQAVAALGGMLEYEVVRVVTREELRDLEAAPCKLVALQDLNVYLESLPENLCLSMAAVIASQGHYDEPALELILNAKVGFVGLLASRKRAATVRELLELQGMEASLTAQIRNPIGLDINAKTPSEVAVSILAEIIAARDSDTPMFTNSSAYNADEHRAKNRNVSSETNAVNPVGARRVSPLRNDVAQSNSQETVEISPKPNGLVGAHGDAPQDIAATAESKVFGLSLERPGYALSPVDAEEIEIATALHFTELEGVTYYFSCPNCKRRFLKNPSAYLEPQNVVSS